MIPAIVTGVSNLLSGFINQGFNERNMELQSRYAKDLADYQWRNFQSPKAQVEALNAAGINPGTIFGEKGGSSLPSPSMNMPSSAPVSVPPLFSLSDMSNYILSVANAKKAGMDTRLSEQEIQNKEVERQAKDFELQLQKEFGREKWISGLSNAYMDLLLKADETSINEFKKRSEEAIADSKESERDMLRQRLENNPTLIRLENDLLKEKSKTERSAQTSNFASANASNTQAEVNRENRRLQSALADIEEEGKISKIEALIADYQSKKWLSEADANEARVRASRLHGVELRRDKSALFKSVDDLSEWLKSKIKIFGK